MALEGLQIVGESLNDSVPATGQLYTENDLDGIRELARLQERKGAAYIDVNVGKRSPAFMALVVRTIQGGITTPLSIDSPDFNLARAGLEACNPEGTGLPILNSISPLRTEMFELARIFRFRPVLMVSERGEQGKARMNHTCEEIHATARDMLTLAAEYGISPERCIFDVGIAPLAIDSEGLTKRTFSAIGLIGADPAFRGCSFILGLTNFSHMLPARRASDGLAIRSALESALLTKLMPLGLNMVVGSVHRNYRLLPPDHPAMACLEDVLALDGIEAVMRVQTFLTT